MDAVLRCKMSVISVKHNIDAMGIVDSEEVELCAVYTGSEENKQFSKYTPSASFKINISNQLAFNKLSRGHEFYVDFIPAV